MYLFFHEITHLISSLIAGYLVWKIYKKPIPAFLAGLLGGFFIDLDHLIDYFLTFGFNFNLNYFLQSYQFAVSQKIYVFFHAWEWIILLLIYYSYLKNKQPQHNNSKLSILSFILALALGMIAHLIIDTISNSVVPMAYSIIYRALNDFSSAKISLEYFMRLR